MTPVSLAQAIPPKVRGLIYTVLSTVFTIELALDGFGYGLIPAQPQAAAFAVLGALGFGMAATNVNATTRPPPQPHVGVAPAFPDDGVEPRFGGEFP